ncbi:MAG: BREX-2 system adenine-specific DNA-methyltransferase PglX [Pseudanabaena sp. M046S1SP1A06QC]|nr:BREX-2 system adenine-specific DNA-methyltransferase PglX [Pseudanabaena sp. M046S1SP1A06QC]
MPIARPVLLKDLQVLLKKLEDDLIDRSTSTEIPEIGLRLRSSYEQAKSAQHTAQSFEEWRSLSSAQVAAAWVLSCVFVRFLEDNGMIEPPRLAGAGDRLSRARDEHELYFQKFPTHSDRDYLLAIFKDLAKLPVAGEVFGEGNGIWRMATWLSGDAAALLLQFFQKIDANTGLLVHDFTDPNWDTRFLGDLYQDLSEAVRKQYALLQTPDFVEAFILDRTLEPALEEFGLEGFKMIDPACGSGHFLLGSFTRLCDRLLRANPSQNVRVLVQTALDSIYGVDINPYAIAIARFRLLLAAMRVSGITRLVDAPNFKIHLVCGDSLLYGSPKGDQLTTGWHVLDEVMMAQDAAALNRILQPYQYHAVVANPPYITPKDAALNKAYRERYSTCHMKYSLAVPFLERIVSLNIKGGFSGQITANSFMKREFGKRLIEDFFPRVDLTHVIDTSGAYIPGHGTPTVILFARNQKPVAGTIRTVMGIRGEPSTPESAVNGKVWQAILNQVDVVDSQSEFVSVADSQRLAFHKHPWSIGGGGASELKEVIEKISVYKLDKFIESIGFMAITGEDDVFVLPVNSMKRSKLPYRKFCLGDMVRDWKIEGGDLVVFPYNVHQNSVSPVPLSESKQLLEFFYPFLGIVKNRNMFGKSIEQYGMLWYEYIQCIKERVISSFLIAFAFVASHNHFVLDRGGKVFKQSAPVIKLPAEATEDDHLALIGLLNSSTACFWMKQVSQQKQLTGGDGVRVESIAKVPYEFAGTQLQKLPLPPNWETSPLRLRLLDLAKKTDQLAQELSLLTPSNAIAEGLRENTKLRNVWESYQQRSAKIRSQMILLQEEIDFVGYCFYNLADESLFSNDPLAWDVLIDAGDRPFCILSQENQEGFAVPSEIPDTWTKEMREVWQRRIDAIENSSALKIIEHPHYKRRWIGRQGLFNHTANIDELQDACKNWLLDRLETYFDFDGRMQPSPPSPLSQGGRGGTREDSLSPSPALGEGFRVRASIPIAITSIAKLTDIAKSDSQFITVGELYRNDPAFKIEKLITELIEAESVPHLPILRYKPTGLRKRLEWEHTWELQRQEDDPPQPPLAKGGEESISPLPLGEGLGVRASIPVPPKYASTDFLKPNYWRLRGKLDVPKERWIAFPHCQGEDGTMAIAWAGYNHLQLAQALSTYYLDIKERIGGSNDPRLAPLLASLVELIPWLKQWHNAIDPEFGLAMGDYYEGFLIEEAKAIGHTVESLRMWEPVGKVKSKK